MNLITSQQDIEGMRTAGKLASSTLEMIKPFVVPGITTEEIDERCHKFIVEDLDAIPAPLNYRGFPKSVCTSINNVVCHGIPNKDERLKNGDIINIDVTVKTKEGYHGDTSITFLVGQCSQAAIRLVKTTQECLYAGMHQAYKHKQLGDIGHAIQSHAEPKGYSVVREFVGHGIGKVFHDDPQVEHYGKPGRGIQLIPGMCFTIEPMINVGHWKTRTLPDGWTVKTKDRRLSAQWEHTMLLTQDGMEVLTAREDEIFPWQSSS